MPASHEDITAFLLQVKKAVSAKQFYFEDRETNMQALACHGLTIDDVSAAIKSLTPADYSTGPEKDYNPRYPGEVWVFGHELGGAIFYIKLKFINTSSGKGVLCLSFHESKYKMDFPYRTI